MTDNSTIVPEPLNPTYAYVGAFVDELQRGGLRHAVICPGSRSTPLAMTLAAIPTIRTWMHIDERSAAFFALGLAKRLDQPVALLCTSGTAAANFLPAIVEAHLTHVPLLVLTADRPPELRECGAPQAIDQNRLYGTHAKWFMEVALPEASNEALRYIRTIACRALAQTRAIPAGPVHLNLPFREPLTPAPIPGQPLPPISERDPLAWQGRPENQPYTTVHMRKDIGAEHMLRELVEEIGNSPRGLIIVGPQTDPELFDPLLQIGDETGYPILADPLSQMRRGMSNQYHPVISSYDAFLRNEQFCEHYAPQLVLRFGAMPTSKPLLLYLKRHAATCKQILIDAHYGWEEPTQLAAQFFYSGAKTFCAELTTTLNHLLDNSIDRPRRSSLKYNDRIMQAGRAAWTNAWMETDQITRQALSTAINDLPALFEGRVFIELAELLPVPSLLYVGNSMPVRDMDTFFWPPAHAPYCLGNRGANGIDGVISSALGASAAGGSEKPAVLVVGDLSFFHDLNGLLAARLHKLDLVIILIHNDGGGIFSFLPQAAYSEHFEQLFGTPTGLDFRPAVEMYGGTFRRIADWETFRRALQVGLAEGGLHVIEVPTDRASNVAMHRQLWRAVNQALTAAGILVRS
ncbi:MAG TPA: 2-succinyl-5-enolpyruvyl-6-hydroxy-3-cyclohexene-1-carboxylic-acid synthase [Ktedonobacteraceae bacterium]|nr:2-succinyl-5-enolpyruvyl-6-hydroxy-3-cyclohexene-1-carboxylic-acid synthase [Ktedonobacteraceae bacterium]